MIELTAFLLARLDEDEAVADRASDHPAAWGVLTNDNYGHLLVQSSRVLADVQAKRRIIEAHPLTHDVVPVHSGPTPGVACANCAALGRSEGDIVEDLGPCETLLALAAIYSDHPDYDAVWRL